MNCQLDFDSDFWSGFDVAMMQEWNITATTSCYSVDSFPSNINAYKNLANKIILTQGEASSTAVARKDNDFTTYINKLLLGQSLLNVQKKQIVFLTEYSDSVFQKPTASGIAYPTENMGFVENNFEYSTAAISHEILHLVLEEEGHERTCYSDAVHENQFKYELKQMGKNKYPVIKKFDC